jgi:hypothetical protein
MRLKRFSQNDTLSGAFPRVHRGRAACMGSMDEVHLLVGPGTAARIHKRHALEFWFSWAATISQKSLLFRPESHGAHSLQTVRKFHVQCCRTFGAYDRRSEKIATFCSLRDRTESRIEFSHCLLDFCTTQLRLGVDSSCLSGPNRRVPSVRFAPVAGHRAPSRAMPGQAAPYRPPILREAGLHDGN